MEASTRSQIQIEIPQQTVTASGSPIIFRSPIGMDRRRFHSKIFTVGPWNWSKDDKKIKNKDKEWFKKDLLSELSEDKRDEVLQRCQKQLMQRVGEAQSCYEKANDLPELPELNNDDFVEMLLLDGCFILSILGNVASDGNIISRGSNSDNGPVGLLKSNWRMAKLDLLRLRNQIPFFVLVDIVGVLKPNISRMENFNLIEAALHLFEDINPQRTQGIEPPNEKEILHLLHLYHSVLVPTPYYKMTDTLIWDPNIPLSNDISTSMDIPSALQLESYNIKCQKKTTPNCSFLDVSVRKGVLEIPSMHISEFTRDVFYSLVVFEDCCKPQLKARYVSAYITFMSRIIASRGDRTYFHSLDILSSGVDAVGWHHELSKFVLEKEGPTPNYLCAVHEKLRAIPNAPKRRWLRWLAELKHQYFHSPWVIISLIAGFILLVCTILQTIYTILGFYKN